MSPKNALILIVDDAAIARRKAAEALRDAGFTNVLVAESADEALRLCADHAPDLFLLDLMMPVVDGMELCKRLKNDARHQNAPVLFVTGSGDDDSRWKVFEAGGVDYIPKPFLPRELAARVETHLTLLYTLRENQRYAAEMEALAAERARQLLHADRLSTIGVLTAGILHEIRNPVSYVAGNIQLLDISVPELRDAVRRAIEAKLVDPEKTLEADRMAAESIESMRRGIERTLEITENIRKFSRQTSGRPGSVSLDAVLKQALALCQNRLKYATKVETNVAAGLPPVYGIAGPLSQVFVNLFLNAADAMKDRRDGRLVVVAGEGEDGVVVSVRDNGRGMAPEVVARLWEPFFTTKGENDGTGLGLSIARQIVEEYGGWIRAESVVGEGTTFSVRLKTPPPPES